MTDAIPFDPFKDRATHEYRVKVMHYAEKAGRVRLFTTAWYIENHARWVAAVLSNKFGTNNVSLERRLIAHVEDAK